MKVLILLISLSLLLMGCFGGEDSGPPKEIPISTKVPTSESTEIKEADVEDSKETPVPPTPIPTEDPISSILRSVELQPFIEALKAGQSVSEALKTVQVDPIVVPTATVVPITGNTSDPTPTPISGLPTPTPTMGPTFTPTPPGPREGQLTPDGQQIFRNGLWRMINPPTPVPSLTPTPTPIVSSKYSSVDSMEVSGIPDLLDYSTDPVVTDNVLSFSSSYVIRDSGEPTVVQLWQRSAIGDGPASDARGTDCTSEGPVVFFRPPPSRGMKYSETEELNYTWTYCVNDYYITNTNHVPWEDATTWTYSASVDPQTFVFSGSVAGIPNRFSEPGKWVIVVFSGARVLSERVIP